MWMQWKTLQAGLCLLLLLAAAASPAQADLSDAQIDQALEKWQSFQQRRGSELTEQLVADTSAELAAGIDLSAATIDQLERVGPLFLHRGDMRRVLLDRLGEVRRDPGADGARAAALYVIVAWRDGAGETLTDAVGAALAHPGVAEMVRAGDAEDLFEVLSRLPGEPVTENAAGILALADPVTAIDSPEALAATLAYPGLLQRLEGAVEPETRRAVHQRLVDAYQGAGDRAAEAGNDRLARYFEQELTFLRGACGRGELLGRPAPDMRFDWVSGGRALDSLRDLKGKVVLLDFWATWCGPCIVSFPRLRALRAHYPESEVAIIGVTSLQGQHVPRRGPPVDTEGDPDEEYRLMGEYIEDQDITWTIAFSRESVFNPDYGVQGIPHVSLIDADGVVRHNGLHPMMPDEEKIRLIDELLADAR